MVYRLSTTKLERNTGYAFHHALSWCLENISQMIEVVRHHNEYVLKLGGNRVQ